MQFLLFLSHQTYNFLLIFECTLRVLSFHMKITRKFNSSYVSKMKGNKQIFLSIGIKSNLKPLDSSQIMHDQLFSFWSAFLRLVIQGLLFCSLLLVVNYLQSQKSLFRMYRDQTSHWDNYTDWLIDQSTFLFREKTEFSVAQLVKGLLFKSSLTRKISYQTFDWMNIISNPVSFFNINEL